ncbi:hypothetical protein VTN00DRAFT_5897 [Thermoascus crustaceus]|uniref:uncharacterized protein n=1 Tax=Thermoascus crustaceus TaxID=5088 RepID=UPI003741FF98
MAPAHTQAFEDAIAVTPLTSHTYAACLREEWCIGAVPHGGYTTALLYRLSTTHFAHTHPALYAGSAPTPISMQLTFLRRTAAGPALLRVEDTKLGARTSTIHVTLSQSQPAGGSKDNYSTSVKVAGYITLSAPSAEIGPTIPMDWALYPPPPPGSGSASGFASVDLVKLGETGRDGYWVRTVPAFPDFRRAAANVEVFGPVDSRRRGIIDQWARLRPVVEYGDGDGEMKKKKKEEEEEKGRWTNEAVAFLIDMFPMVLDSFDRMSTESESETETDRERTMGEVKVKAKYWYPTVSLNVDFKKRLPAQGVEWLYSRVHTKVLCDGRTDLDVVVLDETGDVVALSTQVGLVVSAGRNVAGRRVKI